MVNSWPLLPLSWPFQALFLPLVGLSRLYFSPWLASPGFISPLSWPLQALFLPLAGLSRLYFSP